MDKLELFGNETQVAMQQRFFRLWPYLQANPQMSFGGRTIGIDDPQLKDAPKIAGLIKELGFLPLMFVRASIVEPLISILEKEELAVGRWRHLLSSKKSEAKCRAVLASRRLPDGYRIQRVTPETPDQLLREYQELMQRCGVAAPPGYYLRGQLGTIVAEMVLNQQDEVVATGVGMLRHSPQGAFSKAFHVGLLATEPDQRGQGLARLMLARVMLAGLQDYGADPCHTGVRAENAPSMKVCQDCGLEDSGMLMLGVSYPPLLGRERFTS